MTGERARGSSVAGPAQHAVQATVDVSVSRLANLVIIHAEQFFRQSAQNGATEREVFTKLEVALQSAMQTILADQERAQRRRSTLPLIGKVATSRLVRRGGIDLSISE